MTESPLTESPLTESPLTESPLTESPLTESPLTESPFPDHTLDSAPTAARRSMETMIRSLGYLPAPAGRLATSPALLEGFLKLSGLFETTTLDPLAREVVILTIATHNRCHVCVAMHTAKLTALGASADLVTALRAKEPLADERLDAVRAFTLDVLAAAGAVGTARLREFFAAGYTPQNALEVVLGIGAYTTSTLANRMVEARLDEQLAAFAWTEPEPEPEPAAG